MCAFVIVTRWLCHARLQIRNSSQKVHAPRQHHLTHPSCRSQVTKVSIFPFNYQILISLHSTPIYAPSSFSSSSDPIIGSTMKKPTWRRRQLCNNNGRKRTTRLRRQHGTTHKKDTTCKSNFIEWDESEDETSCCCFAQCI